MKVNVNKTKIMVFGWDTWLNTGIHIEYNIIHFTIYVVK
jgi:hypothetical protein